VDSAWAEVTTGSARLELVEPFGELWAEAVTGALELTVPQGCYDLDLDVVTGEVNTWGVDCGCEERPGIHARVVTGSIDLIGE
jgi:hypothetical protein